MKSFRKVLAATLVTGALVLGTTAWAGDGCCPASKEAPACEASAKTGKEKPACCKAAAAESAKTGKPKYCETCAAKKAEKPKQPAA